MANINYCMSHYYSYYFVVVVVVVIVVIVVIVVRVLSVCDTNMYSQVGGLRDDLMIHEKALDILIELLKKEQVWYGCGLLTGLVWVWSGLLTGLVWVWSVNRFGMGVVC